MLPCTRHASRPVKLAEPLGHGKQEKETDTGYSLVAASSSSGQQARGILSEGPGYKVEYIGKGDY